MRRLANDLSWAEERSAVALANYVLRAQEEAERIARLRAGRVMSCPGDDSSTMSMEGEGSRFSDAPSTGQHMDTDHEASEESEEPILSENGANGQMSPGEGAEANPHTNCRQRSQNWESIMEESEELAYDDLCSSSDTTVMRWTARRCLHCLHVKSGNSLATTVKGPAPHAQGSPMEQMPPLVPAVAMLASGADTVEVHIPQSELDNKWRPVARPRLTMSELREDGGWRHP